jgi:hypothetical protein
MASMHIVVMQNITYIHSSFLLQISDFGLAVTSGNHNKGNLKLSRTLGYVAPEYLLDGMPSSCALLCACNPVCCLFITP